MPESKENFNESGELISRSQRRRDALEIKSLAARLIELAPSRFARLPLDDALRSAVAEARRIRSNVARKRQLQFVAKLLRRIDAEPIRQALGAMEVDARQITARQHRAEAWRDHLLDGGDIALGELLQQRRSADAQAIRQLIRSARAESARGKPPAAARVLFRVLRDMDAGEPLPPLTDGAN